MTVLSFYLPYIELCYKYIMTNPNSNSNTINTRNNKLKQPPTPTPGGSNQLKDQTPTSTDKTLLAAIADLQGKLAKIENKFNTLSLDIRNQLTQSIEKLSQKLDEKIAPLKESFQAISKSVELIESRVERIERQILATDLIITGVPYVEGEKLSEIVTQIAGVLSCDKIPLQTFRLPRRNVNPSPSPNSSIVMKFACSDDKNIFFKQFIIRSKQRPISLNELGFPLASSSANTRIYVNESLTQHNYILRRDCDQLKARKLIFSVFTINGRVFIKRTEKDKAILIKSKAQLNESVTTAGK